MNTQAPPANTLKAPALVFLCLAWLNIGLAVARHFGLVGAAAEMRTVGCAMGLVIFGLGFFLYRLKTRTARAGRSSKAAADRLIGWTLVLSGLASVVLFSSGSLEQARIDSLILGIAVLLAFAAGLSWQLRTALFTNATATPGKESKTKRVLSVMLLAAYAYIVATACAAFLFDDNETWIGGLAPWMIVVFWMMYSVISAALVDQSNRAV